MSYCDLNKNISMAWIQKNKCWPKTEKRTGGNSLISSRSKSYVSVETSITIKTLIFHYHYLKTLSMPNFHECQTNL